MTAKKRTTLGRPATIAAPRETILANAAKLFAERGFEGASLQDVAAAVGISKAAVYHYFPTKQVIYDEIVIDLLKGLRQHVVERVDKSSDFGDQLRQLMLAHAEFFESHYTEFVTLLHGFGGLTRNIDRGQVNARDEYEKLLRQLMTDAKESGALTVGDPASVTRGILSMLNWMARWYTPGGRMSARQIAEEYFELIYNGLRPR